MGLGIGLKTFLVYSYSRRTCVFDFSLIYRLFWASLGPNGLCWGLGSGSTVVFGSTYIVQQLLMFPSVLTFNFVLIFFASFNLNFCF